MKKSLLIIVILIVAFIVAISILQSDSDNTHPDLSQLSENDLIASALSAYAKSTTDINTGDEHADVNLWIEESLRLRNLLIEKKYFILKDVALPLYCVDEAFASMWSKIWTYDEADKLMFYSQVRHEGQYRIELVGPKEVVNEKYDLIQSLLDRGSP